MYDLGEQFHFDYDAALANPSSIIQGDKYRITLLSDSLVRLEYSENKIFEDSPSELIWFRNFAVPEFSVREDSKYLEITTKYFRLNYTKNKTFYGGKLSPASNLKIEVLQNGKVWYYKNVEARNYEAPGMIIGGDTEDSYQKSLYSLDGYVSIDDSNNKVFTKEGCLVDRKNNEIDIYVFIGTDFYKVLKNYYNVTGYPALLPRFALGNWWNRNKAYNDYELKTLIDTFNNKKVPLSVLVLDKDWHKRVYIKDKTLKTGFSWNKELFSMPYEMINYIHSKGIKVGLNINPSEGIYPIEDNYEEIKKYLPVNENGIIPFNVYDPKMIDAYFKLLIHPLDDIGIDFYFIDYNNVDKKDDIYLLKHYQSYDMLRDYKRRPILLGYNSLKASHRYPVLYSGKMIVGWNTLRKLPDLNNASFNSGCSFWAHDLGGYFKGIEDAELYIRSVQLGTFSPIFKFGVEDGMYYKREPWLWDIKTSSIVKNYMSLRHSLIPYLYSESYNYHKEGIPLIEPIYNNYPDLYDDPLFKCEYFLGRELLISPILDKKDIIMDRSIHKFYIPSGTWYDFVTGKKFPGNRSYVSFFRDEDYPVFAKAGTILPLALPTSLNDTSAPQNMEIHIFPGVSNTYKLYEDDGVSCLYKKGYFLISSIEYNYLPNNYTVIIRALEGKSGIIPEKRNYKFRFRNTKKADDVIVYFNNGALKANAYVDGPDFIVEIPNVPTVGQLTLNCKGKDIEIDALRLINEDIKQILSDLQIETELKEKMDTVLFSNLPIKKKRIGIRKLQRQGLEKKFVQLFVKLLEYIDQL